MNCIFRPPAWLFVLWCPVARQPQGREIGARYGRPWDHDEGPRDPEACRQDGDEERAAMLGDDSAARPRASEPGIYSSIMPRIACETGMVAEEACRFGAG